MISKISVFSRIFFKFAKINQPKVVRNLDEKLYKELFSKFSDVQEKERGVYAALAYARIKEGENVGIDEAVFDVNNLMATYRSVRNKLEEKDIFKYDSYQEFASKVNKVNLSMGIRNRSAKAKEISKEKQEAAIENGSAVKVFEDDKNVIFRIDNSQAANAFGSDTPWCITKERGYLESYQSQNATFYFCINKELPQDDPYSKVAIRVIRDFDGNVYEVKFTKKTNDGDDNDISDLQNHENFVEVLKQDTLSLPPSLATKVKNKTASPEEVGEFWDKLLPSSTEEKKEVIYHLSLNTKLNPKISFFVERDSKTTQELIDYLKDNPYDAAILEQLAKVSTDQKTLEKLYETKYWNVQKEAAKKVKSNKVLRDAANSDYNEVQAALASNPYAPAGYAEYILENFEHDGNIDWGRFTELENHIRHRDSFDNLSETDLSENSVFLENSKTITDMVRNSIDGLTPKTKKTLDVINSNFENKFNSSRWNEIESFIEKSDLLTDSNKKMIVDYIIKSNDSYLAVEYAKKNGVNWELQDVACKTPGFAYEFARDITGADIEYCQKHACQSPEYAYYFAKDISEANIEYCQKYACKDSEYAYYFAKDIPGADIEYCQKYALDFINSDFKNKFNSLSGVEIKNFIEKSDLLTDSNKKMIVDYIIKSNDSYLAVEYAKKNGGNWKLQEVACINSYYAYIFAKDIPGAKIEYCQRYACKDSEYAYYFAKDIPGADIEYCQKHACKDSEYAYYFAKDITGADIEYCQKHACKDSEYAYYAYCFAKDIPGADIEKIYETLVKNFGENNEYVVKIEKELLESKPTQALGNFNIENRII